MIGIKQKTLQKAWAILGIFLMLLLTFGPFFDYLKLPNKVSANASTTWTKSGSNPVITSSQTSYPTVLQDGSSYKMWTEENGTGTIRYTTSNDGATWTALQSVTYNDTIHEPCVIKDSHESDPNKRFKMWHESSGSIVFRTSADGLTWTDAVSTTFSGGVKDWENTGRYYPRIIADNGKFVMYYQSSTNIAGETGDRRINYATSPENDGVNWNNNTNIGAISFQSSTANNIVLSTGSSGAWDDNSIYSHSEIKNNLSTFEIWYGAEGGDGNYKIGYATSADGKVWTKSTDNPVISQTTANEWGEDSIVGMISPGVIKRGTEYLMWYTKGDWTGKIGYASAEIAPIVPRIATITMPANATYYNVSNIPAQFTGSSADGDTGSGFDANSTQFYIQRASDNYYWNGSDDWTNDETWSFTSHVATSDNSEVTWNSIITLPAWSSGETYYTQSKVTNKVAETKTSSLTTFYYDNQNPVAATVTTPADSTTYNPGTMPATFSGSVSDNTGGLGLAANSATFYIKNSSNQYWTGAIWSGTTTWLVTTHDATTDGSAKTWSDNVTLPTWSTGTYYVGAKALDRAANSLEGTEISFIYSETVTPSIASVTIPVTGTTYNASNIPSQFSGSFADGVGGTGLNANAGTFYIKRSSDNYYWTGIGSTWSDTETWLATTHTATANNSSVSWTSSATLPSWADDSYSVKAKATNKSSISFEGTAITFTYNSIVPSIASITTPVNTTYYRAANIPGSFSGQTADGVGGTGLNANAGTFYIKRSSDNYYWTGIGSTWSDTETWLATTHTATANNSTVNWTSNVTMPTFVSGLTYTSAFKSLNKAGNSTTGTAITYYYDSVNPATASVTVPANDEIYNPDSMPSAFYGSVADNSSGFGFNANNAEFYIKKIVDEVNYYWTGLIWSTTTTWLGTTHLATTGSTSATWIDSLVLHPSWTDGTYYMGAKVSDKSGNSFAGSEISFAYSTIAPAAITDLSVYQTDPNSIVLRWSAPDNGSGQKVDSYTIKYSTSPITAENFASATSATVVPVPNNPGSMEQMTITGLNDSTKYYFAIKSTNVDTGVSSGVSNVVDSTTNGFYSSLDWSKETIDSTINTGFNNSITTDNNNFSHVSYYDSDNLILKYATNTSGSWVTETVDPSASVGATSAIAMDSDGYPHVSYYDSTNKNLKYAYKDGTGWHIFTVDSGGDVGDDSSIVLDEDNKVYISYYDGTNYDLKYATNSSGSWDVSSVDSGGNVGQYSSIDLDSSQKPSIAYIDYTNYNLKYASYNGSGWDKTVVDDSGQIAWNLSLKIDTQDRPHIGYHDYISQDLKYAFYDSSWATTIVDGDGDVGKGLDMVLDYQDVPHFSYYKYIGDGGSTPPNVHNQVRYLKYAYYCGSDCGWVTGFMDYGLAIDTTYPYGFGSSIDVTNDGKPRISYYDVASKCLKFYYYYSDASSTIIMEDFYKSSNWVANKSIDGMASGLGLDEVQIKLERLSDNYFWSGTSWVSADSGWLSASGTTNWNYTIESSNFTNAVSYTLTSRAHDTNGYGTISTRNFMYNNLNWQEYRINPLIWPREAYYPMAIKDGFTYKAWYMNGFEIYYANSVNGINWSDGNEGDPVLNGTSGAWDSWGVLEPWIIKDGSTYKMWYSASNIDHTYGKIGYATSSDGITWTKSGANPVLDVGAGSAWDNRSLRKPVVIKDGATYKMWYNGTQGNNTAYNVGYATSSDGITWVKSGSNPVLSHGSEATDWDYSNIWALSVLKRGSSYEIYYSGNGAEGEPDNGHKIGYASSVDGISWNKYPNNPVMTHGASGSWNESYIYSPFVMLDTSGSTTYYRFWYDGVNSSDVNQVGYATMDAPADITDPVSAPRFDLNIDDGSMISSGETYYSGPTIWNHSSSVRGDASDDWGIEKVEISLQGSDDKYWGGTSWTDETTWLNSTSTDGYQNYKYTIDDNNFTSNQTYTLETKATDGSGITIGRVQQTPGSDSFVWDSEKPSSGIDPLGATYFNSVNLFDQVTGSASDSISGVSSVAFFVMKDVEGADKYWNEATHLWQDTSAHVTVSGTTSWSNNLSQELLNSIKNGDDGISYGLSSCAIDKVSNTQDECSYVEFSYDNTPPVSEIGLTQQTYSEATWPGAISGTASDNVSGVETVKVRIKRQADQRYWDGSNWVTEDNNWLLASGTTDWQYTFASTNLSPNDRYDIESKASDVAENDQDPVTNFSFDYINYSTPELSVTTYPPDTTDEEHPNFQGSVSDQYYNIKYIEYSLDGATWLIIGGPYDSRAVDFSFNITDALSLGKHTVSIRASNSQDYYSANSDYSFTISEKRSDNGDSQENNEDPSREEPLAPSQLSEAPNKDINSETSDKDINKEEVSVNKEKSLNFSEVNPFEIKYSNNNYYWFWVIITILLLLANGVGYFYIKKKDLA